MGLELAYHQFHADQEAIIMQKLGLDFNFKELVAKHLLFFKSKERLDIWQTTGGWYDLSECVQE